MNREKCSQDLTDAHDLLTMLEQLVRSYSADRTVGTEVPWEGIRLTLANIRERVDRANEEVVRHIYSDEIQEPGEPQQAKKRVGLAGRIRPLP